MDGATIQSKIYYGRGKVAQYVGLPCNQFRPLSAFAPLGNQIATINAAFNAADPTYTKPNLYGKSVWYTDLDGRVTLPGDYLIRVSDGAVWFIASQEQIVPIVAIDCTRSIKIERQSAQVALGAQGYSGVVKPVDILGAAGNFWPASILMGGRALSAVGLPADVKEGGWRVLLPISVPITIKSGDFITDDLARRFAVESAELTDLGWRLTVNEVHA